MENGNEITGKIKTVPIGAVFRASLSSVLVSSPSVRLMMIGYVTSVAINYAFPLRISLTFSCVWIFYYALKTIVKEILGSGTYFN